MRLVIQETTPCTHAQEKGKAECRFLVMLPASRKPKMAVGDDKLSTAFHSRYPHLHTRKLDRKGCLSPRNRGQEIGFSSRQGSVPLKAASV